MLPRFDLQGGLPLCAARTVMLCAMLSVFGTLVFRAVVAPRAFASMAAEDVAGARRALLILARASTALGLVAGAFWLVVQAGVMADAPGLGQTFGAVPTVLTSTAFGHVLLAQWVALAACMIALGVTDGTQRAYAGLGLAACALALQAGHGHAYSMHDGPSVLLACDVLHLLGAGAWLGGLLPLLLLVRGATPHAGAIAARWFSPLGQGCIAALVVSAAFQSWVLIGTISGLLTTAYGWVAMSKLVLFGVLLGFAVLNRYRFAPGLLHGEPGAAKRVLVRSIALQSGAAIAIVLAAVVLSGLPPAMHQQPLPSAK